MDSDLEYKKSISLWKLEQETLISTLELNIEYMEKEIILKQRTLQLQKDSLLHETKFLANFK